MEFGHDNVRQVLEEDRLSSLPDELIHKIMYCFDMKYVVQTCVLSSRWKVLWTSMPCLNFSSEKFDSSLKFVTRVLSHRNHQIQVSSVKLNVHGAANEAFVTEIAKYVFSHNVQQLTVVSFSGSRSPSYPPCLYSSQSLKHFSLTVSKTLPARWIILNTPLDFPALTTMHLSGVLLYGDLFSKCVNLNKLTLQDFCHQDVGALDIITPRLSNLMLINGYYVRAINLVAPQLENLTIIDVFELEHLNGPPGLLSLSKTSFIL